MNSQDPILDYRARAERARLEAEHDRRRLLNDQCDPQNAPEIRVRIWEKLHHLRLPKDPAHAILGTVARETELGLDAVLEVQRQRAILTAPAV
jgi:hypothetical protein